MFVLGGFNIKDIVEREIYVLYYASNAINPQKVKVDPENPSSIVESLRSNILYENCNFYNAFVEDGKALTLNSDFDKIDIVEARRLKNDSSQSILSQLMGFGWYLCSNVRTTGEAGR